MLRYFILPSFKLFSIFCRAHGWKFDATEQDAQEFFNILHLTLDEQLTKLNESNSRVSISSIHFVDAIAASVDPQEVKDDPPVADDKVVKVTET